VYAKPLPPITSASSTPDGLDAMLIYLVDISIKD